MSASSRSYAVPVRTKALWNTLPLRVYNTCTDSKLHRATPGAMPMPCRRAPEKQDQEPRVHSHADLGISVSWRLGLTPAPHIPLSPPTPTAALKPMQIWRDSCD